jgi:hypothetical protein
MIDHKGEGDSRGVDDRAGQGDSRGVDDRAGQGDSRGVIEPIALPDELPIHGPLVSVMVPLYNYEAYVGECLGSVLSQTYEDFELIVVDNCSSDKSYEVASEFASEDERIRLYRNDTNIGALANFQRCYDLARGELAKYLSADDRFADPEALAYLVAGIQAGTVMSTCDRRFIDSTGRVVGRQVPLPGLGHVSIDGFYAGDRRLTGLQGLTGDGQNVFVRERLPADKLTSLGSHTFEGDAPCDIAWWLTILHGERLAHIAIELFDTRIHHDQVYQKLSGTPVWNANWFRLLFTAPELGYLSDPFDETMALLRFVRTTIQLASRAGTDGGEGSRDETNEHDEDLAELVSLALRALERVEELAPNVRGPHGELVAGIAETVEASRLALTTGTTGT